MRARQGASYGLAFAGFYIAWVTILFVLSKGQLPASTYLSIVAIYLLGGVLAGVIVGFCLPLITNPIVGAFVGVISAVPVVTGFAYLDVGFEWAKVDIGTIVIAALALGSIGGAGLFEIFHSDDKRTEKKS